jgi:excisionase family DNA binding protein
VTATLYGESVTSSVEPRPDDRLTVPEVAALLGLTTDYTRTLIYSGRLPSEVDERDRNYRVRRGDVEAFLAGRATVELRPMFVELGGYVARIKDLRDRLDALVDERNRAMVRWRDGGATVPAIAEAVGMTRQHATEAIRLTRALDRSTTGR